MLGLYWILDFYLKLQYLSDLLLIRDHFKFLKPKADQNLAYLINFEVHKTSSFFPGELICP